jgi:hypothetical protein
MEPSNTSPIPFCYDRNNVEVAAYSFSACNEPAKTFISGNVFLDILFQHAGTTAPVTLRTIVPAHLLCGSKEQVEAAVHREIRNVFRFQTTGAI